MKKTGIKRGASPTLFLWIFSIIWLGLYGFLMFPMHLLMFTGTQVSGIVTDVTVHEDDEDGDTYEPKVKYTCGGITTEQRQGFSSSSHYRVGENVKVYCNEKNPTKFAIKSFSNYLMLLFPLLGLVVLFFGVKNLYEDIKRKKLKNKLSQYGIHIEATISEIKDTGGRMNGIPGYKIVACHDGKIFTSEIIYAKLKYILKEGDKIDVYIDPINSNDYWMDTDSIFDRPIRSDYEPNDNINNLNSNYNVSQNIVQNSVENNVFSNSVSSSTEGNDITNIKENATPRPPKLSDKKCPIRRVKIGYGYGIIFSLIGGGIIIPLLISIINTIKDEGGNVVSGLLPVFLFGGIFLLVGLVILIPKIKSNKKKKKLMEGGIKKEGMISEISSNGVKINNQKGYILTVIYDGKLYESEAVYADIYYLVEKGDEIDIYVGTGGDEDYRVDVDNIFYRELKSSYYDRPHSIGDVFNIIKKTFKRRKTD